MMSWLNSAHDNELEESLETSMHTTKTTNIKQTNSTSFERREMFI
jgi:hypothetical protein